MTARPIRDMHALDNARYATHRPRYFGRTPVVARDISTDRIEYDVRGWGGHGIGWIDPVKERRRLTYRRAPKSWSAPFSAQVYHRRLRDRLLSGLSGMLGSTYEDFCEATLRPAVINAVMAAAIAIPPPPPPTRWQRLRAAIRRPFLNRWYRARNRLSGAIYALAQALERLADRI